MTEPLPDLWRLGEAADRFYPLYLDRLQRHGLHERVAQAGPRIRRYAARGPGVAAGLFTFAFEIEALWELKDGPAAWRRLRRWEALARGERLDLRRRTWSRAEADFLGTYHVPLCFFLQRDRQGAALLEAVLGFQLRGAPAASFDLLGRVCNGEAFPRHLQRVTLTHFYGRLGQDLTQWPDWGRFVEGFPPRLFCLAGIPREKLLGDAGELVPFHDALMALQAARVTCGVGRGLPDLMQSEARVRQWQERTQRDSMRHEERTRAARAAMEQRFRALFPDLPG